MRKFVTHSGLLLVIAMCSLACVSNRKVSAAEPAAAPVVRKAIAPTGVAGKPGGEELDIVRGGASGVAIIVSPNAGPNEKLAAKDLSKYIDLMSTATLPVIDKQAQIDEVLKSNVPIIFVGQEATKADPSIKADLEKAAKKNPTLRADSIVARRKGKHVYLAGNNDEAHYYAVAYLLQQWGCRWYTQTEFGECIPDLPNLSIGELNFVYGPPFEIRKYWISWVGDYTGKEEFMRRNYMNNLGVPCGHAMDKYTKELTPPGKTMFNIPISDPKTAEVVAKQVVDQFGKGEHVMMGMEDGIYENDYKPDIEVNAAIRDKYFQKQSLTDSFMLFYNALAKRLQDAHPNSPAKIGFLAYSNITLPPQRDIKAERSLVAYLAPIDIDPNHTMDDPISPPKQEYREMMYRWAEVMQGRVAIYDYDQGMLVWRDIPNPSHQMFRHDVKHYAKAGILGIDTESRHALGTVFLNLYFRGQLMWNPNADVDQLLADFYPSFYGPAAEPMSRYWSAIYDAWEKTIVTEHEYYTAPAIYTEELIERLRKDLAAAEEAMKPVAAKANKNRNDKLYLERMKFTRLSFTILDNYMAMVRLAATQGDYKAAAEAGEKGLAARRQMTDMGGIFTTYKGMHAGKEESGYAWFPGEVQQYRELGEFTDGTKGTLLQKLPLEWAFHRDPNDTGLPMGWARKPADLKFWNANKDRFPLRQRKDYPITEWEMLRTDLYAQAQGVLHPDNQSFTGYMWYKTEADLKASDANGPIAIRFPGLFCEAWLYVNGHLVARREQNPIWWYNDYRFEWDVNLSGHLKPGKNDITLRVWNTHHNGGIWRRPFLYAPKAAK